MSHIWCQSLCSKLKSALIFVVGIYLLTGKEVGVLRPVNWCGYIRVIHISYCIFNFYGEGLVLSSYGVHISLNAVALWAFVSSSYEHFHLMHKRVSPKSENNLCPQIVNA